MPEEITLDPSELASTRTELTITDWIANAGVSWGDSQIEAYMAEQTVGAAPVDYRIPNRQVEIPLVLKERGGTSFATIRSSIQAKMGLWQSQGGYLKRVTSSGGTVYLDALTAQLRLSGDWLQAHRDHDVNAAIVLECKPDFYEAEETLSDHTETANTELIFTESTANGGDFPLGDRVRVVVDEDDAEDQRGLIWSFRARHYASGTTADPAEEAEFLSPLDSATAVALSGASGGTAVRHNGLLNDWTPVLSTNFFNGAYMTHTGTNRVFARCYSTDGTAVEARLVWDVGDLVNPVENTPARMTGGSAFYVLDLGEVRLDEAPTGTHRWQGQIQARGAVGEEDIYVDKLWVVNADEGMGILSAPQSTSTTAGSVAAWDAFGNHTAGTLIGKVAPTGGTWSESGDTTDFLTDGSGLAYRTATSDANLNTGQYARLGTGVLAYTDVQADVKIAGTTGTSTSPIRAGVFARYTDANNWVMAFYTLAAALGDKLYVNLYKRVAGTVTQLAAAVNVAQNPSTGAWRTLRLLVPADGTAYVFEGPQGGELDFIIGIGTDANLASGGALDDGGYGLYDAYSGSTALTRYYDNFYVRTTSTSQDDADAVMFASQSAELSTQGMYREDTGGTAYGPVTRVVGDLPRIPNLSSGGTVAEVFLKPSRGDFDLVPDSGIDDLSARVYRRASWLFVP